MHGCICVSRDFRGNQAGGKFLPLLRAKVRSVFLSLSMPRPALFALALALAPCHAFLAAPGLARRTWHGAPRVSPLSAQMRADGEHPMGGAPLLGPALALLLLAMTGGGAAPVHAEGRTGAQIFSQKCAACHANGGNVLNGKKSLKSDALANNGYDDVDKVIAIITKGKAPMPAYGIKNKKLGLDPEEIEAVANYVLERAEEGWQK